MSRPILIILALLPLTSAAEIYKWVDKNGSINFSDQAPSGKNVEKLNIKPSDVTVMSSDQTVKQPDKKSPDTKPAGQYSGIQITHPKNDMALRANNGSIKITCQITPALNIKKQHKVRFHIDGKPLSSIGTSCEITLSALNRGTHSVTVEVIDEAGKPLIKSATHKFHLQRVSRL